MNEHRLRARRSHVSAENFHGILQIQFEQAQTDEACVPGIKAVPDPARRIVADVFALGVLRIDQIRQRHRGHELLAQFKIAARRIGSDLKRFFFCGAISFFVMRRFRIKFGQAAADLLVRPGTGHAIYNMLRVRRNCQRRRKGMNKERIRVAGVAMFWVTEDAHFGIGIRFHAEGLIEFRPFQLIMAGYRRAKRNAIGVGNVIIFKNQAVRDGIDFRNRRYAICLDKLEFAHVGGFNNRKPIERDRSAALGNKLQLAIPGLQSPQRHGDGGKFLAAAKNNFAFDAAGHPEGDAALGIHLIPAHQRCVGERMLQRNAIRDGVPDARAKILGDNRAAHAIVAALFATPLAIPHEIVRGSRFGKLQIGVVNGINPNCAGRQLHVVKPHWFSRGRFERRKNELREAVQRDLLGRVRLVDIFHSDKTAAFGQRRERQVAIKLVLPNGLHAQRIKTHVWRGKPGMNAARLRNGGQITGSGGAREPGENAHIKNQAALHIGNVRNAKMFLRIRPPTGQGGQIMRVRKLLETKLWLGISEDPSPARTRKGQHGGARAGEFQEVAPRHRTV